MDKKKTENKRTYPRKNPEQERTGLHPQKKKQSSLSVWESVNIHIPLDAKPSLMLRNHTSLPTYFYKHNSTGKTKSGAAGDPGWGG